jgi:hypothetical protein
MKQEELRIQGPDGEDRLRFNRGHQLGASRVFLSVTGLVFSVWAGAYFFRADQKAFLGTPLSVAHYRLQENCGACHQPLAGVTNSACASRDCHQKLIRNNFHESLNLACTQCHAEHANARELNPRLADRACADCHDRLKQDPQSKFFPGRRGERVSVIDRRLYSHRDHRGYHCPVCHGRGEGTINTPFRELFTMSACCKCHVEEACQVCHPYHGQRALATSVNRPAEMQKADWEKIKSLQAEGVELNLPPALPSGPNAP